LIQFVWKPQTPEPLPEDPEQRKAKIDEQAAKVKEMVEKIKEFTSQKSNSAVTIPSAEEIEKASKQKTSELEAAIQKALSTIANPAGEGNLSTAGTPAAGGAAGSPPSSPGTTVGSPAAVTPP
ncbi:MAG: hypothetical protein JO161_01410, partial [Planctomycetaceae bacterium]|nr:hypothetical protein [Planctomycetaceae bacterium]